MKSHRIVSKISKFGNFTIRKGIFDNDGGKGGQYQQQKGIEELEKNGTSRAPLGQISLNASASSSTTTTNANAAAPTKVSSAESEQNVHNVKSTTSSEEFVIYADEDGENNGDDGTVKAESLSSKRLWHGKENVPPNENVLQSNILSSTDDSGTSDEREKLTGRTPGRSSGEDESSELGSEHYKCPSEYMTALTHHSLKSPDENAVKIACRKLKNPMYCAYDRDIYHWHLHRERAGRARNYIPLQSDITETMRAMLIDWCVDVVSEYELRPATFFLAVSITDRTLSRVDCPRDKLQLLGAAALLTAAKMHEISPPTIKQFVTVTDDCYTEAQIQRMEKIVLKATDFSLSFPLVDSFAEFFDYFAPAPLGNVQRHMMWYLLELSTLNFSVVHHHLPSRLGAAAFLIALCCLATTAVEGAQQKVPENEKSEKGEEIGHVLLSTAADPLQKWEEMEQKTKITREELVEPVKSLLKIHRQANASDNKLKAVFKKFSDARHDRVARMELPNMFPSQLCD
uniref:Cyclin N-terminal domain-containing protein n=1 Tax=Globodera rostochiensis TaxID=31243 RepID=A0A914HN41_GLORO